MRFIVFLKKVLSVFVIICAIFGNYSEASDCLVSFNNSISSFGDWLEQDNGSTQLVGICFKPSGKYQIFESSYGRYHGSIHMNDLTNMTKQYFSSTSFSDRGKDVTVSDFQSFNSKYKFFLRSERFGGTNVVLNCYKDEVMFGDLYLTNINSLTFSNASSISFKSIQNYSNKPVEIDGCGVDISVRTAKLYCNTNSKLYAYTGYNNIHLTK